MRTDIYHFLLNLITEILEELAYRLGCLIAKHKDNNLADRFLSGVKTYERSNVQPRVLTLQPDL